MSVKYFLLENGTYNEYNDFHRKMLDGRCFYCDYHDNGKLYRICHSHDGVEHGDSKEYYENGKLKIKTSYSNGKVLCEQLYAQNGNLLKEYVNYNDKTDIKKYYSSGEVKYHLKDNKRIRWEECFYKNGNIKSTSLYNYNCKLKTKSRFDQEGNKITRATFKNKELQYKFTYN